MMKKKLLYLIVFIYLTAMTTNALKLARLSYKGGGDWYNDPSMIPNMTGFFNKNISNIFEHQEAIVSLNDPEIENYPILIMTGHGNVNFSSSETSNLRAYLKNGGFLMIDDDYGMDKYIRKYLQTLFKDHPLVEIQTDHSIYSCFFNFESTPKIHLHNDKRPQLFGIFINKRLSLLYTYETNITDGWASKDVHKDSREKREQALRFGANIIFYALTN